MKRTLCTLLFSLVTFTGFAQESPTPPDEPPASDEVTAADVAGKVESMGEAFTEMKNIVDALNRLRISGYVQAQYLEDESSVDELSGTGTKNRDQFSIRRGRVKFVYTASPVARVTFQVDASSSSVSLKDGYVELIEPWTHWKNTLTAGQFNWPFGFEVMYSSSDREMPERSRVVRTLFPGERDRGVMFSGLGFGERFHYRLGVVNGTGTTQSFDFNSDKDIVGRAGFSAGPLDLSISGYHGKDLVAATGFPPGRELDKTRQGFDFQLLTPVPGLGIRGEYITGEEKGADVDGWYFYLIKNLGTRHQFVLRADDYDPNSDLDGNSTFTLGGSYIFHWDPNSKVMLAYEQPKLESNDPDDDVLTVRLQYKF